MCNCVNVQIQSYSNQTVLDYPEWFKSSKKVRSAGIDNCILEEIKSLWEAGIQTLESCCGHNQADGYICVLPEYIPKMQELGYELRNESRPDIFKPKSV